MKILINNQEINFTLEKEKSVKDVITYIKTWLQKSNLLILAIAVDGKEYSYSQIISGPEIPIESVNNISIKAQLLEEIQITRIQSLLNYFNNLKKAITDKNDTILENLLKDYKKECNNLLLLFVLSEHKAFNEQIALLNKIFAGSTIGMIQSWTAESKKQALNIIETLNNMLNAFKHELYNPLIALNKFASKLEKSVKKISEVSLLLQTGKDKQAMETIIDFSETTQSLLRILSYLLTTMQIPDITISKKSFEDFYKELNSTLKELIQAFEKKDYILIGDLLEYEIAPRIEDLIKFSNKITKKEAPK